MKREINRQLVHISGVLFVIAAQFFGKSISVIFLTITFTLLIYSEYIIREEKKLHLFAKLESKLRGVFLGLERQEVKRPFTGAMWFFFASALTFLIFPQNIASGALMTLAVGDGLSTIIGLRFGRHKIIKGKTLEGSLACFLGSLTSIIFLPIHLAVLASVVATLAELLPNTKILEGLKNEGLIDDNLLIPMLAGVSVYIAGLFL